MSFTGNSDTYANLVATPVTKVSPTSDGGKRRSVSAYMAAATFIASTVGQTFALARLPARARLVAIKPTNVTMTAGAVNLGLYRTNGTLVKADNVIALMPLTVHTGADAYAPTALQRSQLISAAFATEIGTAGATGDVQFDLVAAVATVATLAKDIQFDIEYIVDE